MRVTRISLEPRVDLNIRIGVFDMGTEVMDPDLPGYTRWSGVEPFDLVIKTLLGAVEALQVEAES